MTYKGSGSPVRRPAMLAGRLVLGVLRTCWAVVSFLFWGFIILTLPFARLFILFPLSMAMLGGAGVAIYYAWHGVWAVAGEAAEISVVSGLLFWGYSYCAEKMDPSVGMMPPPVRWHHDWWS